MASTWQIAGKGVVEEGCDKGLWNHEWLEEALATSSPSVRAREGQLNFIGARFRPRQEETVLHIGVVSLWNSWKRLSGDCSAVKSHQSKEIPTNKSTEGYRGAWGRCRCARPILALLWPCAYKWCLRQGVRLAGPVVWPSTCIFIFVSCALLWTPWTLCPQFA